MAEINITSQVHFKMPPQFIAFPTEIGMGNGNPDIPIQQRACFDAACKQDRYLNYSSNADLDNLIYSARTLSKRLADFYAQTHKKITFKIVVSGMATDFGNDVINSMLADERINGVIHYLTSVGPFSRMDYVMDFCKTNVDKAEINEWCVGFKNFKDAVSNEYPYSPMAMTCGFISDDGQSCSNLSDLITSGAIAIVKGNDTMEHSESRMIIRSVFFTYYLDIGNQSVSLDEINELIKF